jgi:hypothetical protein
MRASEVLQGVPETGSDREELILGAVRNGYYAPVTWSTIQVAHGPYIAKLQVSSDGLRIGDTSESIRLSTGHGTAQLIANDLGSVLPTPKLSDEIWAQADVRIPPLTQPWYADGTMGHLSRMIEQSALVDELIAQHGGSAGQLVADVGKDWVITRRLWNSPSRAANYGWLTGAGQSAAATSVGGWVIQGIGLAHGLQHVDYSQTLRLIYREVEICDQSSCWAEDIYDVIKDPELAPLISHEGVLPSMEHPGISGDPTDSGGGDYPPPPPPPDTPPKSTGGLSIAKPAMLVAGTLGGFLIVRALLS